MRKRIKSFVNVAIIILLFVSILPTNSEAIIRKIASPVWGPYIDQYGKTVPNKTDAIGNPLLDEYNRPIPGWDPIQVGKLRYGLSGTFNEAPTHKPEDAEKNLSPNLTYVPFKDQPNFEIQHMRSNFGNGGVEDGSVRFIDFGTLSDQNPLNLITTEEEYLLHPRDGANAGSIGLTSERRENKAGILDDKGTVAVSEGKKLKTNPGTGDENLSVKTYQFANDSQSAVVHLYKITNTSTTDSVTVYPIKMVDTELDGNDGVPVYSRGVNPKLGEIDGVYIKTPERGVTPPFIINGNVIIPETPASQSYRLDYYLRGEKISNEHWPEFYSTHQFQNKDPKIHVYQNALGPLNDIGNSDSVRQAMNQTDSTTPILKAGSDSAIWMSWGKVEIPPGESYTLRYDVGISVETETEKSKTAKNLTEAYGQNRQDGKNYPDDVIEYTIKYKSKKGSLDNIRFTDELKDVFDDPTKGYDNQGNPTGVSNKVTVTSTKGKSQEFDMSDSDVYDKSTRKLTVPPEKDTGLSIEEGEELTLTFRVKLSDKAANQNVVNIANVNSRTSEDTIVDEDIATETPLPVEENKGKVIIKYQNKNGVSLVADETKEGKIGTNYDFSSGRKEINGYLYDSVTGSETGKFTKDDQTIVYTYKDNAFDVRQEVFDKDGNNADNGTVEMGGLLKYKTTVTSNLEDNGTKYANFTVTANVSPYITVDQSSIKFESASGIQINSVVYDSTTNTITGTIASGAGGIDSSENLILSYEGTVKNVFDVDIVASSTAEGPDPSVAGVYPYSDNKLLASEKPSKPVTTRRGAGNLEFSASSLWDFGSNEIKNEKEEIPLKNVASSNLTVTDNRAPGNDWYLTAQLDKEFTNTTSGNVMKNILKYRKAAGDTSTITIPFGSASDILIQGNTSAADRGKPINLAADWGTKNGKGLFLDVPGGFAKRGVYEADITWTLSDTP